MGTNTAAIPDTSLLSHMADLNEVLREQGLRLMSLWLKRNFFGEPLAPESDSTLELALESRESLAEQWRYVLNLTHELGFEDVAAWMSNTGSRLLYQQTDAHRDRCLREQNDASNVLALDRFRNRARNPRPRTFDTYGGGAA